MKKYLLSVFVIFLGFLISCSATEGSGNSQSSSSQTPSSGSQASASSSQTSTNSSQTSASNPTPVTNEVSDVKLIIKLPTKIDNNTKNIVLTIENLSDNQYGFGKDFGLAIYLNNQWYTVPTYKNYIYESILITSKPHSKVDTEFPLNLYYNNLIPGKYCITKGLSLARGNESKIMRVEFTVNSQSSASSKNMTSGYQSLTDANMYQGNDVELSIKSPANIVTNTTAIALKLDNLSDKDFMYFENYSLEIYINKVWYIVPKSKNNIYNAVGITSFPHSSIDIEFPLSEFYNHLIPGRYRIVKEIISYDVNGLKNLAVEFEMN